MVYVLGATKKGIIKMLKTNINKTIEWQNRSRKKAFENQRKRRLEKLKAGTLYKKLDHKKIRINSVPANKDKRQLKKIAWNWFSKYIRLRDSDKNGVCKCITCGRKHKWDSGQIHAGHFIPKSRGNIILFDERNNNAQCKYCNTFLHGNLAEYQIAIDKKWGPGTATELAQKSREKITFTEQQLKDIIKTYKIKSKLLLKNKNEKQ